MYLIDQIKKVQHTDGRIEIIPCDTTVELLALNLKDMNVSLPLSEGRDSDTLWEYLNGLDIEIGQAEAEGLRATRKYSDQVCRAVDEFNLDENEYIDYDELSRRMEMIFKEIEAGTFEPYVKVRWRRTFN